MEIGRGMIRHFCNVLIKLAKKEEVRKENLELMEMHLSFENDRYLVLLERLRKTLVFAKFLKIGVWSFYDTYDIENTIDGHAIYSSGGTDYGPNKHMVITTAGNVDYRLQDFDRVSQLPPEPHFPFHCLPTCPSCKLLDSVVV